VTAGVVPLSLESALDELVYRHDDPWERVRQERRVLGALIGIVAERTRQELIGEQKRSNGIAWRSCADPDMGGGDMTRVAVLAEEFGEVANAALETAYGADTDAHLRKELIEVAAVCVAWIEAIDARNGS
jgi:hypothetical protein